MLRLWEDLCATAKALRRAPGFFVGTTLTLAIGVGATSTVFSLVHAVLLQPLPNSQADEIVRVWPWQKPSAAGTRFARSAFDSEGLLTFREASQNVLTDFAAIYSWQGNPAAWFDLGLADRAERLRSAYVTPNFFRSVGISATLGRVFDERDEAEGQSLMVISHGLWLRSFGGDPSVVGRSVSMTAGRPRGLQTFTILGVLPREFRFTYPLETEAWVQYPWSAVESYPRGGVAFTGVARLKAGVSFEAAQARAASLQEVVGAGTSKELRQTARLERLEDWMVAESRPSLFLMAGVALLLLLLTCATVAGFLFVRSTRRQGEMAIRSSLGADRPRLIRELLLEGATLATAGSVCGVGVAALLFPGLRAVVPDVMPRAETLGMSGAFLAFGVLTAALVTLLSSVAPALRGSRLDLSVVLNGSGHGASANPSTVRWRLGLVGFQSAVATSLLVLAVLLLVSFWRLQAVPLGFDGDRVLTVEMRLLDPKYRQPGALAAFQSEMSHRVRAIPGVVEMGVTTAAPFRGTDFLSVLRRPLKGGAVEANARTVDPGYFSVLRIAVKRGRVLLASDTPERPKVVVVSESLARAMFGDLDPLGQTIDYDGPREVVGVVADLRYQSRDKAPRAAMYLASSQQPSELMCLVVRTSPNAGDVVAAIRHAVHAIDPALPVMNAATVNQIVSESVAERRFYTVTTTTFATIALLLTSVGLGLLVARTVAERQRELAIRAALGATVRQLVSLVARQGIAPVVGGAVVGLFGAYSSAKVLQHFLFEATPQAPWAYATAGVVVVAVATAACLTAARGVTDAHPAKALRAE